MDFIGRHEVNFIFDDFDIKSQSDFIVRTIDAVIANHENYQYKVFESMVDYLFQKYEIIVNENSFKNEEVVPSFFHFSPDNAFGTFSIGFEGGFEKEHGAGVIIKNWDVFKLGLSEICMSKF